MTKAKAKARAKARALAKLRKPKAKGDEPQADETANIRAADHGPNKGANRPFGGQQNIKSATRTTRGAARSR